MTCAIYTIRAFFTEWTRLRGSGMTLMGLNMSGSHIMVERMENMGSGGNFGKSWSVFFPFLQLDQSLVFMDIGWCMGYIVCRFFKSGKCSPFQPHSRDEKQNSDHSGGCWSTHDCYMELRITKFWTSDRNRSDGGCFQCNLLHKNLSTHRFRLPIINLKPRSQSVFKLASLLHHTATFLPPFD